MTELRIAHTIDLDPDIVKAVREVLAAAFDGDFADTDWANALGGLHVLAFDDDVLVGHAALVQRRLLHGGRALNTGYVEALGVHPDHRGRGHAAALMAELERIARGAYELGALASSEMALGFYAARGWQLWRGPTSALTPDGIVRTPDEDGAIFVLPGATPLDLDGDLACDWRDGDVW